MAEVITGPWKKGMNNRLANYELPADTLRDAANVDITDTGVVRSRPGSTLKLSATRPHSIWSDGIRALFVEGGSLKLTDAAFTTSVLASGLGDKPVSYRLVNGVVYYSNEYVNGRVLTDGTHSPWGLRLPAGAPQLSAAAGGALDAGLYQAICTFVDGNGRESGCSVATQIQVTDGQAITISAIPQPSDASVSKIRIYATTVNGEVFFRIADIDSGSTGYTIRAISDDGALLKTQFKGPPPPGQLIDYGDGRLLIARGNTLWITDPLNYGLVDRLSGFYLFPERITLVLCVPGGVFVSADQTYYMSGIGTANERRVPVLPYKAIEGAVARSTNNEDVIWFSEQGYVLGGAGGTVKNISSDRVAVDSYSVGALMVREANGIQQYVGSFRGLAGATPLAAGDFFKTEVV